MHCRLWGSPLGGEQDTSCLKERVTFEDCVDSKFLTQEAIKACLFIYFCLMSFSLILVL